MIEYTQVEIEQERQDLLAKLPATLEMPIEDIRERFEHEISYSEIIHSVYMLMEMVDNHFLESPSVIFDEEAFRHASTASTALFNLYTRIGLLRHNRMEPEQEPAP